LRKRTIFILIIPFLIIIGFFIFKANIIQYAADMVSDEGFPSPLD
jgi:hypothetical protein